MIRDQQCGLLNKKNTGENSDVLPAEDSGGTGKTSDILISPLNVNQKCRFSGQIIDIYNSLC